MKATTLGHVEDFVLYKHGIEGHTAQARFRIDFLGERAVRIRISPDGSFEENPYSLLPEALQAVAAAHAWRQNGPEEQRLKALGHQALVFTSAEAMVRIGLAPLRVALYDGAGAELCVEDAGLGTTIQGAEIGTYRKLQPGERFIGLGEKTGPLDRRGKAYTHWNTDAFGYTDEQDPIYLSTPFYIGLHQGRSYGFFLNNTYRSHFNFGASSQRAASIIAEGGTLDYVLFGGSVPQIVQDYTGLTGRTPLPPLWALGLQQCRYSYYPDYEVTTVAETFRKKGIPADVIYLDIHYMEAYKVFTWHKSHFAQPQALMKQLHGLGFKVVVIFDPGVKVEPGYPAYDEGMAGDHFVKYPDGEAYQGQVWPGWCHFPDFARPETRAWWAGMVKSITDDGVEGFWTDMNEPATWGQRIPEIIEHEMEGRLTSHKEVHNVYGMQMARATYEGALAARTGKRPFVLTRAGFSGIQRYAAVWTGDNRAEDSHMLLGVRLLNAMGLAGVGFCGMDIGGFVGDADRNLFARWMTIGAFSPLSRIHTMVDSRDSEPWSYGEKNEAISRNYISLRYRLLPLFYSLFKQMEETGLPVQRSLAVTHPHAWQTYDHRYHNQFMLGAQLLVAPCSAHQDFCPVFLPPTPGGAKWYYLYEDTRWEAGEPVCAAPLELLPAFVAPGSIIPMHSVVQHTGQAHDGVLTLHLYRGPQQTSFDLYQDEGDGYGYQGENYYRRDLVYTPDNEQLILKATKGNWPSPYRRLHLVLHGFEGAGQLIMNGQTVPLVQAPFRFVEPLPAFDPFGNDQTSHACPTLQAEMAMSDERMEIGIVVN